MTKHTKGVSLAVTTAVMWGIMGIFVRNLSTIGLSNIEISFFRCFIAGVSFFLFLFIANRSILKINLKGLIICLFYGITAYGISFVSYTVSVSRIPVSIATVLMFMSPIWVAILSKFLLKEDLTKQKVLSIGICIIGAVLVTNLIGSGTTKLDIIGVLAGIINGIGVALQIILPHFLSKDYEKDTILVYGFIGATAGLAIFISPKALFSVLSVAPKSNLLINLFGIGILCTMVANVACVTSTKYIEATTTSIISALEVVVGTIVGIVLYNEKITLLQLLGAVIIVVGAILSEIKMKHKLREN